MMLHYSLPPISMPPDPMLSISMPPNVMPRNLMSPDVILKNTIDFFTSCPESNATNFDAPKSDSKDQSLKSCRQKWATKQLGQIMAVDSNSEDCGRGVKSKMKHSSKIKRKSN